MKFIRQTPLEVETEYEMVDFIMCCIIPVIGTVVGFLSPLSVTYSSNDLQKSMWRGAAKGTSLGTVLCLGFWGTMILSARVSYFFFILVALFLAGMIYFGIKISKKRKQIVYASTYARFVHDYGQEKADKLMAKYKK